MISTPPYNIERGGEGLIGPILLELLFDLLIGWVGGYHDNARHTPSPPLHDLNPTIQRGGGVGGVNRFNNIRPNIKPINSGGGRGHCTGPKIFTCTIPLTLSYRWTEKNSRRLGSGNARQISSVPNSRKAFAEGEEGAGVEGQSLRTPTVVGGNEAVHHLEKLQRRFYNTT